MVACVCVVPLSFNGLLCKPGTRTSVRGNKFSDKSFLLATTATIAPFHITEEICRREFTGGRLLTPVTTNIKNKWRNCSDRCTSAVNMSSFHMVILARNFCDTISHNFDVSSSAHVILSGFWIGPDIEDGWGFVEAFVHRI